jgi:hypothetical protein
VAQAAHDDDRQAVGLAGAHEVRRRGYLVCERDLSRAQRQPRAVERPAQVGERGDPCCTDRDVGRAQAERATERVGDDDADVRSCSLANRASNPALGVVLIVV